MESPNWLALFTIKRSFSETGPLRQALKHGLILRKVHAAIKFKPKRCLGPISVQTLISEP